MNDNFDPVDLLINAEQGDAEAQYLLGTLTVLEKSFPGISPRQRIGGARLPSKDFSRRRIILAVSIMTVSESNWTIRRPPCGGERPQRETLPWRNTTSETSICAD